MISTTQRSIRSGKMPKENTVILGSESISKFKSKNMKVVLQSLSSVERDNAFIPYGNRISRITSMDTNRLINDLCSIEKISPLFRNVIYSCFSLCPISTYIGLLHFSKLKKVSESYCIDKALRHIESLTIRSSSTFCKDETLKFLMGDQVCYKLFESAIGMVGTTGKYVVNESKNFENLISIEKGNRFDIHIDQIYADSVFSKTKKIFYRRPKVVVLDGIVESISQIDNLLRSSYENRKDIIFFCRGFLPDVVNTMAVNQIRETIGVCPVTVSFDEYGIYQLKDISSVVGCDIFSIEKGDQISSINFKELPEVESITVTCSKVIIESDTVVDRVLISDALENTHDNGIKEKRIKSLTPNLTNIEIGSCNKDLTGVRKDRIENAISTYRKFATLGKIKLEDLRLVNGSIFETFSCYYDDCVPQYLVKNVLTGVDSLNKSLSNLGAGIFIHD